MPFLRLMAIILLLIVSILVFFLLVALIGGLLSTPPHTGPRSSNFNGRRFINPSGVPAKGFDSVATYATKRVPDKWPKDLDQSVRQTPLTQPQSDQIQYTFVNHSTFLIQHKGQNILTDPIWSKRCSPFQFMGPKRQRPPGLPFEMLPKIDIVLLSHNHYDHMDKQTIKRLAKRDNPTFIVSLGNKVTIEKWISSTIIELDWHQQTTIDQLTYTALPANHFSSRGTRDRNTSLWCGYLIASENRKINFVGDTGYSNVFKEIGETYGPFDLCLIPIGAYLPRWFMSPIHVAPEESVQLHFDLQSKKSVAMHFGTFKLADDNPARSARELIAARAEAHLSESDFHIPKEGESYLL